MDGRVLDASGGARFCVVNFAILPSRPKESAHAYDKIWTPEGSPLVVTSRHVQQKLQARVAVPVELAMRYQNPSILSALKKLRGTEGHAICSSSRCFRITRCRASRPPPSACRNSPPARRRRSRLEIQPPYFDTPEYIAALVASAGNHLDGGYDHLLFSFHGIPERHLRKSDPTGCHCLQVENCCEIASPAHATCYRAQCFKTVAAFVAKAGVPKEKYSVAFQSRLGKDPWLKPYSDLEIAEFPARGIKKLLVICPAFVSDCLETIEEIGIRGRETFLAAGGEDLTLIPCMNEHPQWLMALEKMVERF